MALTKEVVDDKIEIVGETKEIQVRTATVVKEDGKELTRTFSRRVISCISSAYNGSTWTHTDTDMSGESSELQGIATAVWTTSVKNIKKAATEATEE